MVGAELLAAGRRDPGAGMPGAVGQVAEAQVPDRAEQGDGQVTLEQLVLEGAGQDDAHTPCEDPFACRVGRQVVLPTGLGAGRAEGALDGAEGDPGPGARARLGGDQQAETVVPFLVVEIDLESDQWFVSQPLGADARGGPAHRGTRRLEGVEIAPVGLVLEEKAGRHRDRPGLHPFG